MHGGTKAVGLLLSIPPELGGGPVAPQGPTGQSRCGPGTAACRALPPAHTIPPDPAHCPLLTLPTAGPVEGLITAAGVRGVGCPLLMDQLGWKREAVPTICYSSAVNK